MKKNLRHSLMPAILFVFYLGTYVLAEDISHFEWVRREFGNPSSQAVFVVAHRGDWRTFPENTLEAVNSAIALGVDIIEIDVRKTQDGHFVLMHDSDVARTTGGKGKVEGMTIEQVRALRTLNALGRKTDFRVPTLEEVFKACRGRVMLNLDKVEKYLDEVYALAVKHGVEEQIILKSAQPFDKVKPMLDKTPRCLFMPIVSLDKKDSMQIIDDYERHLKPLAYEIIPTKEPSEQLDRILAMSKNGTRIWINSLWDSLSLGHSDDKAVDNPDANWGWILDKGATIIQTDRPQALLKYLESQGRRPNKPGGKSE